VDSVIAQALPKTSRILAAHSLCLLHWGFSTVVGDGGLEE
jgi:hypothetical protein